ncbi:MAG: hypothetical protein IJO55_05805 [Lachnospiraceae bacterium]|nr:hypothetical protein [Lachnospiraceae bacterium]
MKKNYVRTMLAVLAVSSLCVSGLTGCANNVTKGATDKVAAATEAEKNGLNGGGILCLKVNPEIAITYDEEGLVTEVSSRNEDAKKILESYKDFEGKSCREVVGELVTEIGDAGYFTEEIEGEGRQIVIEIERGSKLPSEEFLDEVVKEIRENVKENKWTSPVSVEGESEYGITDYDDTDYGPNNDGVTDYDDTDYGPNNDGVTDYDDTDYGPNNDGVTDYDDTDYGPNNDGVTDYDDTDYGPNNDGVTDYDDGASDYDDGASDYDDGDSEYDD